MEMKTENILVMKMDFRRELPDSTWAVNRDHAHKEAADKVYFRRKEVMKSVMIEDTNIVCTMDKAWVVRVDYYEHDGEGE